MVQYLGRSHAPRVPIVIDTMCIYMPVHTHLSAYKRNKRREKEERENDLEMQKKTVVCGFKIR